jgi:hydrogenase/urease accessory protein HupE
LREKILRRILVATPAGETCAAGLTDAGLTEQDGLLISGRWDCPSGTGTASIDVALLEDLGARHNHVARAVSGESTHDEVLSGDHRRFTVTFARDDPASTKAPPAMPSSPKAASSFSGFLAMGIGHILTGYDHLVFLLGLVLARVRPRPRPLLGVVTAFTVAHSITLALATLDVWAPSARIVEPAIALSIVYVGVENFFTIDPSRRWTITFPFGLVHGFGFASALREVALARRDVPAALVAFNAGVEIGQIGILLCVVPIVAKLRERPWIESHGVRWASAVVVVLGVIWFVLRIVG